MGYRIAPRKGFIHMTIWEPQTSKNAILFSFEENRSIKNSAYQAMLCQSRNGHVPEPSMTSSASVPRNQRNAEPGKKNRRRNKKERRNRRMSDGHSRGLHNAEKLILPKKKKPLLAPQGEIGCMVCAEKESGLGDVCGGDSPHTTACGPDHFKRVK